MSASKDAKAGTWIVYARYTDWQGGVKVLHKRGFKTKREATNYERVSFEESKRFEYEL